VFLISLFSSVAVSHGGIHFHVLGGITLFFLLLWSLILIRALHLLGVSVGDTDEVGVSNAKSGGLGKHDEEVELLGHL